MVFRRLSMEERVADQQEPWGSPGGPPVRTSPAASEMAEEGEAIRDPQATERWELAEQRCHGRPPGTETMSALEPTAVLADDSGWEVKDRCRQLLVHTRSEAEEGCTAQDAPTQRCARWRVARGLKDGVGKGRSGFRANVAAIGGESNEREPRVGRVTRRIGGEGDLMRLAA